MTPFDDDTAVISIGYANNEVGTVQDVGALAAVARERGIPLHLDAVQAAGWLPLSAAALGVDALSVAGHNMGQDARLLPAVDRVSVGLCVRVR